MSPELASFKLSLLEQGAGSHLLTVLTPILCFHQQQAVKHHCPSYPDQAQGIGDVPQLPGTAGGRERKAQEGRKMRGEPMKAAGSKKDRHKTHLGDEKPPVQEGRLKTSKGRATKDHNSASRH